MTTWKINFSKKDLEELKRCTDNQEIKDKIDVMIQCLGMCKSNDILVTVEQN